MVKLLKDVMGEMQPALMWKWFQWVCTIPRGSGNVTRIRDEIVAFAKARNLQFRTDDAGNVCVSAPASPGYESAPGVVLQAHLDMVVDHSPSVRPSFSAEKDGIIAEVHDDGWLRAKGTSLGADDGIGIATLLAILESPEIPRPSVDCLFTADEETTMVGAHGVRPSLLTPGVKYLINVDSEDDGMLCLGCAGGANVAAKCKFSLAPVDRSNESAVEVSLSGLTGGHTGVQIHLYRANAVKMLACIVSRAAANGTVRISDLEGGQYCNALPISATAVVVVPKSVKAKFVESLRETFETLRADYCTIEKPEEMKFAVADVATPPTDALTAADTKRVLAFWALATSNPTRMSPEVQGFVESSCAWTIAKLHGTNAEFAGLARTSRETQWVEIECAVEALGSIVGATVEITDKFAGWLPQPSTLAKVAEDAHIESLGRPCQVFSIHAGLECGIIMKQVPGLEAISIGPKVEAPHTCDERCNIKTVNEYYAWLLRILRNLN